MSDSLPAKTDNSQLSDIRPEDLPPVQPPSAGYIVQLFLIPAFIVIAVISVWAMFGKLAEEKTDWRQLVSELGRANEHRRWRAALELAQVLRNEQIAPDETGVVLHERPEVASALTGLLLESFNSNSTLDDDLKHQEYLTRTLGTIRVDEVTLPVLAVALAKERNVEVRKSSIMSLTMIAGRHFKERAAPGLRQNGGSEDFSMSVSQPLSTPTITEPSVLKELKLAAQDEVPAIRHLSAYALGLVSGPDCIQALRVLLLDGDEKTQANAAVALARNGVVDGVPTMIKLLKEGLRDPDRESFRSLTPQKQQELLERREFEQPVILRNCVRAVGDLWDSLSSSQQETVKPVLFELSENYRTADVRTEAKTLLSRVQK